jgi:hypothetical protein
VFLLPFIILLPAGLWWLAVMRRATYDGIILLSFVLVPLPIVVALPEAPFYATARAILAAPFGVLIATAGLAMLAGSATAGVRAIVVVAIALMPWQFSSFARDYFSEYPQRSATWIDSMNFQGVARYVIEQSSDSPKIFLSHDDIGEDKAVKWKFHLIAAKRLDLWTKTAYLPPEQQSSSGIEAGSLLVLSPSNPRLGSLTGDGWTVATVIEDAAGTPSAAILKRR